MDQSGLRQALLDLVEERSTPEDWAAWWKANSGAALQLLNPGQALRLRSAASQPPGYLAAWRSQVEARKILVEWNASFTPAERYSKLGREELEASIKAAEQEMKQRSAELKRHTAVFSTDFPEFARLIKRRSDDLEEIGPPATDEEIAALERQFPFALPDALKQFLRCTRAVRIGDTFQFDINAIWILDFAKLPPAKRPPSHGMLVVAELWWEGDGDQLVLDVSGKPPFPAFYYSHESSPPAVTRVAGDFSEMLVWLSRNRKIWG